MTPEELEKKMGELRWKASPEGLDRKILDFAGHRGRPRPALPLSLAAAAALLFIIGAVFFFGSSPDLPPPSVDRFAAEFQSNPALWGIVTDVRGSTAIALDARLKPPLRLETGEDGLASIALRDGSTLKLNTSTRLDVDRSMWSWILSSGEIWGNANPKGARPNIEIRTTTAAATITGTEFDIRAAAQRTLVAVRHGLVEVLNSFGKVQVGSNRQAQATADAAPRVVRLVNDDRVFGWAQQLKGVRRHAIEKSFLDDESSEAAVGSLEAGGAPLAIRRHSIRIRIDDDIATTEVEQVFFNATGRRMEGVFRFPLPKDASISRFAMTVTADKLMEGRIVEKHRARQIYESILRRREDPGLLEWQEGNQFTARVFPIEPNSEKRIVIAYQQTLPRRDGRVQLVMPLVSEALAKTPPQKFTVELRVTCRGRIVEFESPSHKLDIVKKNDREYMATAEASDYTPLNDLVLDYRVDSDEAISALTQDEYFMLRIRPEFKGRDAREAGTFVYWLDVSHSTTPSLQEIQYNLLGRLLARLTPQDKFTIFTSDLTGKFLFDSPVAATPENREKALSKVWGIDTGGATDLGASLADLAKGLPQGVTLVYIGDGVATLGVRDAAELAKLYRETAGRMADKFYAFALGNSVNEMLLEELALQKTGALFRMTPGENLTRRVREFSWALAKPMLKNIEVKIDGAVEVYPAKFTALPRGEEMVLLGKKIADKITVNVTGSDDFKLMQALDLSKQPESSALARIWAQRKVRSLLSTDQGGAQRDAIIALSEKYTIMTPYTSLLVLETEQEFERYRIEKSPQRKTATGVDSDGTVNPDGREGEHRSMLKEKQMSIDHEIELVTPAEGVKRPETKSNLASTPSDPSYVPAPTPPGSVDMPPPADNRPATLKFADDEDGRNRRSFEGDEKDPGRAHGGKSYEPNLNRPLPITTSIGELIKIVETSQDGREQLQALGALESQLLQNPNGNVERPLALEGLQTLLRYRPLLREGWLKLGRLYEESGDRASALRAVTTIVEIAPEDPTARQQLCQTFIEKGALRQARVELAEVTRLRPEEPEAYLQLAQIAAQEGAWEEAESHYRRMLRFNFHERFGDVASRAREGLAAVYRQMIDRGAGPKSELEEKIRKLQSGGLEFKDVKVVLSWKTDQTDVDLWITAPGEEKCTYQQKSTFRGGRLDRDVTTGFGPETYTMPETRAGKWLIEVNYFRGNGVKTSGTVEIILFEGTSKEVRKAFPFTMTRDKETVRIFEGDLQGLERR